jgi:hypothetical protein
MQRAADPDENGNRGREDCDVQRRNAFDRNDGNRKTGRSAEPSRSNIGLALQCSGDNPRD